MKILLSAFACHPRHGSEPGTGWHWTAALSDLGHEVTVLNLVRASSRTTREMSAGGIFPVHRYSQVAGAPLRGALVGL